MIAEQYCLGLEHYTVSILGQFISFVNSSYFIFAFPSIPSCNDYK